MNTFLTAAAAAFLLTASPLNASPIMSDDVVATHGADTIAVGDLHLFNIFTRETPPNARNAGGFLSIHNYAAQADRLVSASSPVAERVELHTMTMENDVMRMRMLPDGIELPGEAQVDLAPGGLHVMFIGLEAPFEPGAEVPVTLVFENNGEKEIMMPVRARSMDADGSMNHSEMNHGDSHGSHQ